MPIYEYKCQACAEEFELLVLGAEVPACPSCQSTELARRISGFAVATQDTRQRNWKQARERHLKGEKLDKDMAQRDYERKHREEGH